MKNDKILKFIIQLLEKKKTIEKKENILSYNFIKFIRNRTRCINF